MKDGGINLKIKMMNKFFGVFKIGKKSSITHVDNKMYWNDNNFLNFEMVTETLYKDEDDAIKFVSNIKEIGMVVIMPVYVTGLSDEKGE